MKNRIPPLASVSIVGAGPGDPELLTLKAMKAIQKADVILYDALINKEILKLAAPHVELKYVGKRKSLHACSQEEINQLLVTYALQNKQVVRLKGGDPFVFGRGSEEAIYLKKHGVPCTVIPGISSAIAAPAYGGIPVTHRGLSESFWVITATTSSRELSADVFLAAKSKATVVILMGLGKLEEIVHVYQKETKGQTPIAIIQNGSCHNQKTCIGTIDTIQKKAKETGIQTPATLVIGPVVNLHQEWNQPSELLNLHAMEEEFIYQNLNLYPVPA